MLITLITSYMRKISYIINLELTMHRILNRQNLYGPLLPTTLISNNKHRLGPNFHMFHRKENFIYR